FLADERYESAWHRAEDGWSLRTADDHLELLDAVLADRHDQTPARLELLVQGLRELGCRGGDGDRIEGSLLGETTRAVADMNANALVAGGGEVHAREFRQLRNAFDRVDLGCELREDGRL